MRIEIETSVANDSDAHQWLDRIIYTVVDGWHLWDTTDHLDSSEFETTTWVRDRGTQGEEILELFKRSNKPEAWNSSELHTKRIRVTSNPSSGHELNPKDAVRFAQQPLCILVENEFSDGLFLKRVVDELDEVLSNYWNQDTKPIQVDSVGGITQMPMAVKGKVDQASVRPRLFVIADSDKDSPSARESKGVRKLHEACDEHNIPRWILAKRAAENYLPPILLKMAKPYDQEYIRTVDAWDRLSNDQKNFFNMKKGLPRHRDDDKYPLFEGVLDADYKVLTNGFGKRVHKCWEYDGIEIESELRTRSQCDLEHGIDLIRKEV